MLVQLALYRHAPAGLSAGRAIGPSAGDDEDDRADEEIAVSRLALQRVPPVARLAGGEDAVRAEPVDVAAEHSLKHSGLAEVHDRADRDFRQARLAEQPR